MEANLEFLYIKDGIDANMTILDTDAYVYPIERSNCTIKESIYCIVQVLPFKCLSKKMIIALVVYSVHNLNQFLVESGISKDISPLTLVTGASRPDFNMLKLKFREYIEI